MQIWNLSNGIKVLFKKTDGLEVSAINIFSRASVSCEDFKKAGISNFTPLAMSKATTNRSVDRLALDIAHLGASFEASGDYDYSGFSVELLSEHFVEAVEILSDIIINPAFYPEEIAKDINAVCASISSKKESIRSLSLDHFRRLFYKGGVYSISPTGEIETISSIKREDLIAWHKASYNAANIMICVVGNIPESLVKESFEKYFSPIAEGEKLKRHSISPSIGGGIHYFDEKFKQAYIVVGYPAPSFLSKSSKVVKLLSVYFGGRMSSKLFVELREKMGLAYELGSMYPARLDGGFFGIYIGLDKENIDIAIKRIDEILKDICLYEIEADELKNIKNYIKGICVLERQTVSSLCFQYGIGEFLYNDYQYDEKYIEALMNLTSKDIFNTANEIFSREPTKVILRPK